MPRQLERVELRRLEPRPEPRPELPQVQQRQRPTDSRFGIVGDAERWPTAELDPNR